MGSVNFLRQAKSRSITTYVACIITISAIALDPFSQQILTFTSKSTPIPGYNSSALRSQAYDNASDHGEHGVFLLLGAEMFVIEDADFPINRSYPERT